MAYLRKVKTGWQININYTDPATGKRKRKTKLIKKFNFFSANKKRDSTGSPSTASQ